MTTFHRARIRTTTVAIAYTAGSGSLAVVDGSQFGSTFPIVVIVSRAGVRMSVLEVTARATNTLTIAGAVDGTTDVNLIVGDEVSEGPCALHVNELQDAFNATAFDQFSNLTTSEVSIAGTTSLTGAAFGRMHVCSGTTANYTVTLPAPSGNAGRFLGLRMASTLTKFVTITHNASETIDGSASRLMWKGEAATLLCDGTNWVKTNGISTPMIGNAVNTVIANVPNNVWTKIALNGTVVDNTGLMNDLANNQIIVRRSGVYTVALTIIINNFVLTGTGQYAIYKNGSALNQYAHYGVSGTAPSTFYLESDFVLNASDITDLRVLFVTGGPTQGVYTQFVVKEQSPW